MSIKDLEIKPFTLFDKSWSVLTSGPIDNHNSMTIAWGGMGTLWHRDVVTVYVKPIRYTYQFMEANEYFVLSFFDEKHRDAMRVMGSHSGRDVNKDELAHLTPIDHNGVTIYKEARTSIICKKIYFNDLLIENMPQEEVDKYYKKESPHRMYVGEVIEIINK